MDKRESHRNPPLRVATVIRRPRRTLLAGLALALLLPFATGSDALLRSAATPAVAAPGGDGPPAPPPPAGGRSARSAATEDDGRRACLTGRLRAPRGEPLPEHLSVRLTGPLPPEFKPKARYSPLEKDGTFAFDGLFPGSRYEVSITAFGFTCVAEAEVVAGAKETVLTAWAGETIEGVVVDSEGSPVGAGVPVNADAAAGSWCGTRGQGQVSFASTRDDGTFLLEYLAPGSFVLGATRQVGDSTESGLAAHIPHGSRGVTLRLAPDVDPRKRKRPDYASMEPAPHESAPSAITGRLVLPEGVPGADGLRLVLRKDAEDEPVVVRISRRGAFDSGTLAAGSWNLRVVTDARLEVGGADGIREGTRDLAITVRTGGTLSGVVLDPEGRPVGAGFVVNAVAEGQRVGDLPGFRSETVTAADGSFLLHYLGEHTFSVFAEPPHGSGDGGLVKGPPVTGCSPGGPGVFPGMLRAVPFRGTLVDAAGQAVNGVELRLRQEWRSGASSGSTDGNGRFEATRLAAGAVRVFALRNRREVDLGEFTAPAEAVELRLPAGK